MKVIAFYLPQFHEIPENNEWWGKGFTEWVNVKKAVPLFKDHYQPRVPLNHNYYNLLDLDTLKWQAKIAKEHGVYGFCIYHYWFDGHMLLQKPMEIIRQHPDIDINYCISWANENWTNAWVSANSKTLISQKYGGKKEWKEHFDYLLQFFNDDRYIKENGSPLLIIYRPEIITCLNEMLDYWDELAIKNGFNGITYLYQHSQFALMEKKDDSRFKYQIEYQPQLARLLMEPEPSLLLKGKRKVNSVLEKYFHKGIDTTWVKKANGPEIFDYDKTWDFIINHEPLSGKSVPGAFVDWDNTPRRERSGSVAVGASPEKFKQYLKVQIRRAKEVYKKDYLFLFAWNEWAEGGYVEPDEKYKYGYLNAIHDALNENNEGSMNR